MDEQQVRTLAAIYRLNPTLFQPEELENLRTNAAQFGIDVSPPSVIQEDNELLEIPKQLVGGFIKGFTSFIDPVEKPRTIAGGIARSVGDLVGFAGLLWPGSWGLKGVAATTGGVLKGTAEAAFAGAEAAGLVKAGISAAPEVSGVLNAIGKFRSVPMYAADKVMELAGKSGAGRLAGKLLEGHPVIEAALESAAHLGVASAVHGLPDGMKNAVDEGLMGAALGTAFAGIGNVPFLKEQTTLNQLFRGLAGAAVQGVPSSIRGASTPQQVYDYMMGGIFGYHSLPESYQNANKYLGTIEDGPSILGIETRDDFRALRPEVQNAAVAIRDKLYTPISAQAAMVKALKSFPGTKDMLGQIDPKLLYKKGDQIQDDATKLFGEVADVDQENHRYIVKLATGETKSVPFERANDKYDEHYTKTGLVDATAVARTSNERDFDNPAIVQITPRIRTFVEKLVGNENLTVDQFYAHVRNIDAKLDDIIGQVRRGTAEGDVWDNFENYVKEVHDVANRNNPAKKELTDEDLGPIKQFVIQKTQDVSRNVAYYNGGEIVDYPVIADKLIKNIDNKTIAAKQPKLLIQDLTKDDGIVTYLEDFNSGRGGLSVGLKSADVTMVDEYPDKPSERATYVRWKDLFTAASKRGQYLYGNVGDKPRMVLFKYHPDTSTPENTEATFQRIRQSVQSAYSSFDQDYAEGEADFVKRGYGTAQDYKRMVVSNIRYGEMLDGATWAQTLNPTGRPGGWRPYDIVPGKRPGSAEWANEGAQMSPTEAKKELTEAQRLNELSKKLPQGTKEQTQAYLNARSEIQKHKERVEGFIAKNLDTRDKPYDLEKELPDALSKAIKGKIAPFINSALDFNKRQQILFSDTYPMRKDLLGQDRLRYVMEHDYNVTGRTAFGRKLGKPASDGAITVRDDLLDKILKATGLPPGGFAKPFGVVHDEEHGTLLLKMAFHNAGPEQSADMAKRGIDMIISSSAAKQPGTRKFYDIPFEDGKFKFKDLAGDEQEPEIYNMPTDGIRVSFGTYDGVRHSLNTRTTLAKQVMTYLTNEQTTQEERNAFGQFLLGHVTGTPEANKLLDDYMKTKDPETLQKLIGYDENGQFIEDSKIEDVGLQNMLNAMNTDKKFRERARTYIMHNDVVGLDNDLADLGDDLGDEPALEQRFSGALALLKMGDGKDSITMSKPGKDIAERMMMNYFMKRLTSPRVKEAGKGVLRKYDSELQTRLELTEKNFFLDDDWKKLRITGLNLDGREEKMTLGEQFDIFQNLKKSVPEKPETAYERSTAQTIEKMRDKLTSLVLRVPMYDISGGQSLELAGFTGRRGGGILIHDRNMDRLGGADLDFDTAFFYFGMPKELHKAFADNQHAQDEYGSKYPNAIQMFLNRESLPLADKPLGKFDPYTRLKIGYEVSKGRGRLLGVAIANRFTMHAFYSAVRANADEGGRYVSELPDQSLITFTPSKDKGELLRVAGKGAIEAAADLGKYTSGMVSGSGIRARFLAAAFDKISRTYPDGRVETIWERGKTGVLDAVSGEVRINKELNTFAARTLYQVPEFSSIYSANNKFYGRNFGENRPWGSDEIRRAASDLLDIYSDTPIGKVADQLLGLYWKDSNLKRFLGAPDDWEHNIAEINSVLGDDGKKLFPFLTENVKLPFKQLSNRARVLGSFMDFSPDAEALGNIATEAGRDGVARNEREFNKFLKLYQNAYGDKSQEEFLMRQTIPGSKKTIRDQIFYKNRFGQEKPSVRGRAQFLRDQIDAVDDMISSRFKDVASLMALENHYRASGLEPEEARDAVAKLSDIKLEYDSAWSIRMRAGKENAGLQSFSAVIQRISDLKNQFMGNLAAQETGGRLLNLNAASDFFDQAILGSIGKGKETTYNRLGLDIVPNRIIQVENKFYDQAFEKFNEPYQFGQVKAWLTGQAAVDNAVGTTAENPVKTHEKEWLPGGLENVKLDKELTQAVKVITDYFSKIKGTQANDIVKLIRQLYDVAQVGDLTRYEVIGFSNFVKQLQTGPGIMKMILRAVGLKGELGEKGLRVGLLQSFKFVKTTADDMKRQYLEFHANNVFDENGRFNDKARILKHWNPETGTLEKVYADTVIPSVHADRLIDIMKNKEDFIEQVRNYSWGNIDKYIGWATKGITVSGTKEDIAEKLVQLANRQNEYNGAEFTVRKARKDSETSPEEMQKVIGESNMYLKRLLDLKDFWNGIKDKTVNVAIPGRKQTMTGRMAVKQLRNDLRSWSDNFFNDRIRIADDFTKSNIFFDKNGVPDWGKMFKGVLKALDRPTLDLTGHFLSYDESQLMNYMGAMKRALKDQASSIERPSLQDVSMLNIKDSKAEEWSRLVPEIKGKPKSDARKFLFGLMNGLDNKEQIAELVEDEPDPIRQAGFKKAQTLLKSGESTSDTYEAARRLQWYYGKTFHENSTKFRIFGQQSFSGFDHDMAFARGEIGTDVYLFKKYLDETPFRETPYRPGYWPHMNFDKSEVRDYVQKQVTNLTTKYGPVSQMDKDRKAEFNLELQKLRNIEVHTKAEDQSPSALLNSATAEAIMDPKPTSSLKHLEELGGGQRSSNMLHRRYNVPGYSEDLSVLNDYVDKTNRATFINASAYMARQEIEDFDAKKPMGESTKDWSMWWRMYVRDNMGYPTTFTDEMLNSETLRLKRMPYYWLSDHASFVRDTAARKMLIKITGAGDLTAVEKELLKVKLNKDDLSQEDLDKALKEKQDDLIGEPIRKGQPLTEKQMRAMERWANTLRGFSSLEGKFEVAALLSHPKSMVANIIGGKVNTWVYNGAAPMRQARDFKTWQQINPDWTSMHDVDSWVSKLGVMEQMITLEGNLVSKRYGANWEKASQEIVSKLRSDPSMKDTTLGDILEKNGIERAFLNAAGSFMRFAERKLRVQAFKSSYLAAKNDFDGLPLAYDNPYLVERGLKGMGLTQFLYGNANRMAFSRSNLGRVWTRFKVWSYSSIKFRQQIISEAAIHGWRPGSAEFARAQRLMTADLFSIGLASLLPYSIFYTSLPAPLSYFQNLAEWVFGNKKERDMAFYAGPSGLPKVLSPLQEILPPIDRIPKGIYDLPATFGVIWGGEFKRIGEFTSYSLFPFGRMTKDVLRAYENPEMAADWITGIPLHAIGRAKKEASKR